MTRKPALLALGLATLALSAGVAQAAPTDFDPGFGTNGRAAVQAGGGDVTMAIDTMPDGRLVVVGYTSYNHNGFVSWLNPDGSLSPAFDAQPLGVRALDLGGTEEALDVAVDPTTGRVAVAGDTKTGTNTNAAVWLLEPNGGLAAFGTNGAAQVDLGATSQEYAYGVAFQPDGKVVIAGRTTKDTDAFVARFTSDGKPDPGFGQNGVVVFPGAGIENAQALAVQPDGKIVVASYTSVGENTIVDRVNSDGSPDGGFGTGGAATVDRGAGAQEAYDVALQPDGKIVLAGRTRSDDALFARLNPDGSLDQGFGDRGGVEVDNGADDELYGVALQPDGKIVAAGYSGPPVMVVRLNPDGSRDTSFAPAGVFAFGGSEVVSGVGVAVQQDGKLAVAAYENGADADALVYRLEGGPPAEPATPRVPAKNGSSRKRAPAVRCAGKRATIVATAKADHIRGTKGRDVIVGLGGNDVIKGLGGNDLICGGPGNDRIYGGKGRDVLRGEAGRDRLSGGPGRDRLIGGSGRNRLKD
jgi:uncharacterized delta-60 repeat protein